MDSFFRFLRTVFYTVATIIGARSPKVANLLKQKEDLDKQIEDRLSPLRRAVQQHQNGMHVMVSDVYLGNTGLITIHMGIERRGRNRPSGAVLEVPPHMLDRRGGYLTSDYLDDHLRLYDDNDL